MGTYQIKPGQFQIGIDDDEEEEEEDEDDINVGDRWKEGSEDELAYYDDEIMDEVHGIPRSRKGVLSKRRAPAALDEFNLEVDMERFMDAEYDDEDAMDEEEEMLEEYRKTFG